ncbi:hypothetical protein [Burkholderia cepacia]|uniref:hypothetical protein n=1 Tax=Burkholderia cepacia TaxID=292 RepID=UPI0007556803|nr:hypothetical protein [Burkholderia cepacia]
MNVAIEYPQDFPLDEVDRKVFSHQIRKLLNSQQVFGCELDSLRERAGLEATSPFGERDEITTLITLSQRDATPDVVDRLLERLGRFLNVRLSLAEYAGESDSGSHGRPRTAGPFRIVVAVAAVTAIAVGGYFVLNHFFTVPADAQAATLAPVQAPTSDVVAPFDSRRLPISTVNDSVPTVDMTFESSRPGSDLASLRRVLPADGGVYLVSLQVTPIIAATVASASSPSVLHQASKVAK